MSIVCNYENTLDQDLLKIYKDDAPNLDLVKAIENRVKVLDYKILVEPYTDYNVPVSDPCNPDEVIMVKAELKKIIVVATIRYNALLVVDDCIKEALYDGGESYITAYDIYATLPIDAPVPDVLEIIPEFHLETKRIVPINEEDVDYYMFAVDGYVELKYL